MLADVVKIGNSKGIRLPATLLKQCGIEAQVELEVKEGRIIITAKKTPRAGWAAAFKRMHDNKDDELLWDDSLDADLIPEWKEMNQNDNRPVHRLLGGP